MSPALIFNAPGRSWLQLSELTLSFVLWALIGLERELRQMSAVLRTYTVVGLSAALIVLVCKYGFNDVVVAKRVVLDPSRVAAQIFSGLGFIGAGVIFVRKDAVRGLTTAASVWLAAAVGMACGAGPPLLLLAITAAHFVVVGVFPIVERALARSRWSAVSLRIVYLDGRGILRDVLAFCTQKGLSVTRLRVGSPSPDASGRQSGRNDGQREDEDDLACGAPVALPQKGVVTLTLEISGVRSISKLTAGLSEMPGVVAVQAGSGSLASE